jgi:glycosyltransferase involved in cell wall biosynthesis
MKGLAGSVGVQLLIMPYNRNLHFVVFRYSHHSPHSGYSRVAEYGAKLFNSWTIRAEKPLPRSIIRERMLWKISAGTPGYDRTSMAVELKTILRMMTTDSSIFHFLYGETTYHYAGLFNHKRNHNVVATFHLPPVGIRESVQIDWHIKKLSAIVCVGRNQQEYFERLIGGDRVFFVPLGVASDYFVPPLTMDSRDPDLCLIVGENYRDYPTLRGVIELVAYLRPKTKFVIVTPPVRNKLLGEHPNLTYTSGISEPELLTLYQSASVLLMPLHDATANNAILEGMSCGLPIVVSDVGAVRDYVDPACGILIPPYRSRLMAEAVIDILSDETARAQISAKCRENALQFSWEKSVGKLMPVYDSLG